MEGNGFKCKWMGLNDGTGLNERDGFKWKGRV